MFHLQIYFNWKLSKLGPFVRNTHNNCTFGILSARFVENKYFVPTRWNVEDRDRPSVPTAPWNLIRESDGRHLANLPKSTTLSRIFPSFFFFSFFLYSRPVPSSTSFLFQLRSFRVARPATRKTSRASIKSFVRGSTRIPCPWPLSDVAERMIPLISLLEFFPNRIQEEILSFFVFFFPFLK